VTANQPPENVIHVQFGPGGGRKLEDPPPIEFDVASTAGTADPVAALYTPSEVSRLFAITPGRLRYWRQSGFIEPSGKSGNRAAYTFQDLISLRAAKELLDEGMPLQRVRKAVASLRTLLPTVASPLSELRVFAEGGGLVARSGQAEFDPDTGQLRIGFEVSSLTEDVVRVLRSDTREGDLRKSAYEYYLTGCRLDEDENTWGQAEEAYRLAIEADPSLGNAFTNLGNLRYRRGLVDEAEKLYREALRIDPEQPEAEYNMGFVAFERGDVVEAVARFEAALELDPAFADAHFNLAMAMEEAGMKKAAREHWESYLEIEPRGPWADVARRHLPV
jgi:tetratricopeptide (TPR) repeat protein